MTDLLHHHGSESGCGGGCCDECEPATPVRNNYFTGKLLVERDFTDEQFYFREKIRQHHQRLHGVGVVCGLDIVAHPNPACRDRMVVLKPGTAIDCCGHDINVIEEEVLVLDDFPAFKALKAAGDDRKDHRLEFCIRYRECPTEEIPVLFDECGCDDTQCAPNRILESFEIDLRVDAELPDKTVHAPTLGWKKPIRIAHAAFVALDPPRNRAFILTGEDNATLYQIDLTNELLVASVAISRKASAIAVSPDGKTVAVSSRPAGAASGVMVTLSAFAPDATGGIAAGPANEGDVPGTGDGAASLVASSAGFVVLNGTALATYNAPLNVPGGPAEQRTLTGARIGIAAAGPDKIYVADASTKHVFAIDLAAPGLPDLSDKAITGSAIDAIAFVPDPAGDRVAIIDEAARAIRLVDPGSGAIVGSSAALAATPIEIIVSPEGRWAWVVIDDGTKASVVGVDLGKLRLGETPQSIGAVAIGRPVVGSIALSPMGDLLYVPFFIAPDAGVAVISITETDCWGVLEGKDCPGCVVPDCLILATVESYHVGRKLEDLPGDPVNDPGNNIARIDNDTWRTRLPSTQAIAQALLCLRNAGGIPGPKGDNGTPGSTTDPGEPEEPVVAPVLAHVCAINWPHRDRMSLEKLKENGLRIGFDLPVIFKDIDDRSLEVQVEVNHDGAICWCNWLSDPRRGFAGLKFETQCENIEAAGIVAPGPQGEVEGVLWRPGSAPRSIEDGSRIRVLLHGDLIADVNGRSVDGNHLSPWLGTPGTKSGDGIAGGMFESWFVLKRS